MKTIKRLIILISILFIVFFFGRVLKVQDIVWQIFFPTKYSEYVETYAKEYNVDNLFVYAVIKAESNFNENANSVSGAKGLMQIMDNTAKDIADDLGISSKQEYDLYDAKTNIMFGTKYLSELLEEYNNNQELALAAYNAGKGNVKKWIENGTIQADGSDVENVPFKETNAYIRKILYNYKTYKKLYE